MLFFIVIEFLLGYQYQCRSVDYKANCRTRCTVFPIQNTCMRNMRKEGERNQERDLKRERERGRVKIIKLLIFLT